MCIRRNLNRPENKIGKKKSVFFAMLRSGHHRVSWRLTQKRFGPEHLGSHTFAEIASGILSIYSYTIHRSSDS